MVERFRLNLDAPFLRAADNPMQPKTGPSPEPSFQRPANDVPAQSPKADFGTDKHLRRPPVPQRAQADYTGETMARYINGLESRLSDHIRRHASIWHGNETRRVLRRWSMPGANHPAPSWATPRDVLQDARDYAGQLVRGRIVTRMRALQDIRISRTLGGYGEVDPLHLLFHKRPDQPAKTLKQKM